MMLCRPVVGYPYPSMAEHLIVFTILFLAGSLWATCVRRYVQYRMEAKVHE